MSCLKLVGLLSFVGFQDNNIAGSEMTDESQLIDTPIDETVRAASKNLSSKMPRYLRPPDR